MTHFWRRNLIQIFDKNFVPLKNVILLFHIKRKTFFYKSEIINFESLRKSTRGILCQIDCKKIALELTSMSIKKLLPRVYFHFIIKL